MTLSAGSRLGPYEIVAAIGAGGMGEVYRATDTKLKRQVAIKILPAAVAADPDRLARFQREAEVLASLNHPNIAHIHGLEGLVGRAGQEGREGRDGAACIVMELVEGEDLAQRIVRGPIPLDEVLPIAKQIAEALEAAHEQGIIHRDLKPANIKVRPDGTVKVLDFGLAKALEQSPVGSQQSPGPGLSMSPTLTSPALMTGAGMILGTAAYMAPEQARGRAVDRRADIWAFGAVLYEMLTGRRAFGQSSDGHDEDLSMTLASVLKDDVKWDALPADTPASIRRLLRRCLERDPKRRLSAIGDARFDLDEAAAPSADSSASAASGGRQSARVLWLALAAVTLLWAATLVAGWRYYHGASSAPAAVRFSVEVPGHGTQGPATWYPTISPDGATIAFVAPTSAGGQLVIWIRPIAALDVKPLSGTEGAGVNLIWSPDSRSIAYASGGKLRRVDIAGGAPVDICDIRDFSGGSWHASGAIVYADNPTGALFVVKAAGGTPSQLKAPGDRAGEFARWPVFLPDGRHVLYESGGGQTSAQRSIYVRSLDDGPASRLTASNSQAVYVPGFLIFQRDRSVVAQPFDAERLELSGEPRVIAQDVFDFQATGRAAFSASDTGVLVYRTGNPARNTADLVWTDRTGKTTGIVGDPLPYGQVRLSPDEKRVVATVSDPQGGGMRISILELTNGVTSTLTQESGDRGTNDPLWAPTSDAVAFESSRNGKRDFFKRTLGDTQDAPLLESADNPKYLDDWSADGQYVLFHLPQVPAKLEVLSLADHKIAPLVTASALIDSAHFSHDGRWFAYNVSDSGKWETWVAAFPNADHRRQISRGGGGQAWWRADGREILYLSQDGKMMSVEVTADPKTGGLDFHAPQELFQSPIDNPALSADQYTVTHDGQRFLFVRYKTDAADTLSPINVVTNWKAALN